MLLVIYWKHYIVSVLKMDTTDAKTILDKMVSLMKNPSAYDRYVISASSSDIVPITDDLKAEDEYNLIGYNGEVPSVVGCFSLENGVVDIETC